MNWTNRRAWTAGGIRLSGVCVMTAGMLCHVMPATGAGAAPTVEPNDAPIPVFDTAAAVDAAFEQARQSGRGLVADLTLGYAGTIARAPSAKPLAPGRYRLHAWVASQPHDHIISEAVTLRLGVGDASNTYAPRQSFPKPGTLAPVRLDFVVREPGPVRITAAWFVGDSHLDRQRHRDIGPARQAYRAQRQSALDQLMLAAGPGALDSAPGAGDDLFGDLSDLLGDTANARRLQPQALQDAELPAYRMALTGLMLERLSPVAVEVVETDQAAYELDADVRASVTVLNHSAEPVTARLVWTVEDDARPGETVFRIEERVPLEAGTRRVIARDDPLDTAGITRLGRVHVEADVEGMRGDAARTPFVVLPERVDPPAERRKTVFAHYMGCYPAGTGATRHHRTNAGDAMRHERSDDVNRRGGRFRNFPLLPWDPNLTLEESADLEIRRAMRIGIDGFAVDAWAGGDGAKEVMDALLRVAEEKDYPFEITICLDPACGAHPVATVREVLERWGDSPKLARRNGKPLIFGYFSHAFAMGTLRNEIDLRLPEHERDDAVYRLRTTELGWHLIGQTFRRAEEQVGQPIFYHYDLIYFFHPMNRELVQPGMLTQAAGAIARHVPALGSFGRYGFHGNAEDVAAAVREAGAEWGGAGGMHQKENLPHELFMPRGTEWLRSVWADKRRDEATLVQLITWNDYTENTNIAPAYNTRYTIYDLTGYFIDWWRNGEPPTVERDRVYLTYAKYPKDAEAWPFSIQARRDRVLEVLTILTAPATVHLPGRDIRYEAPAGLHVEQFPIVPGPVIAELIRADAVTLRLESPEPITDRPFREDNAMVCFSTEFDRHWQADFGDEPPLLYSEYGDFDGDGLPNWFEMYWFNQHRFDPASVADVDPLQLEEPEPHPVTRWPDMRTATLVDAQATPNPDGRTNLESYQKRMDPTLPAVPELGGGR